MATERRMRVLIRTRPLSQGNYGGILQAYAMQQVLSRLGLDPMTDLSRGDEALNAGFKRHAVRTVKRMAVAGGPLGIARPAWVAEVLREERDVALRSFVDHNINSVALFQSSGEVDQEVLDRTDVFLIGSDQVWRGAFGRVSSYLYDFLPADDARPRIAYAASFGTDDLSEYSEELIRDTRQLAQRFHAISVREDSAVGICADSWQVPAIHVVDPTMLLDVEDYARLTESSDAGRPSGGLVSYVLDKGPHVDRLPELLASRLGSTPRSLLPADPPSMSAYRRAPEAFARPSVEEWVDSIARADFMVTDSFHGTVFAILHHVPFITISNHARGAARFKSLLGLFGLEDRLCEPSTVPADHLLDTVPDWCRVEDQLSQRRATSVDFLRNALQIAETTS